MKRRERDRRAQSRRAGSPSLLPLAPAIWLEPNPLDTVVSGRLSSGYDLSGNTRPGVQATAGNRPLVVAGEGPGGTDCWRFAARPDFLSIAHDAGLAGLDWTFFVVVKKVAANQCIFSKAVGAAPRPFDFFSVTTTGFLFSELAGVGNISDSTWHIAGARRNPSGTNTTQIFRDKAIDATGATASLANTGTPAIRIGLRDDANGALNGDIAHVSAWTRALSDAEVTQVNAYFTARFGL